MRAIITRALAVMAMVAALTLGALGSPAQAGAQNGTGGPWPCTNHGGGVGGGWFPTNNGSINCMVDYRDWGWGHYVVDLHVAGSNGVCDGTNAYCAKGAVDLWVPAGYFAKPYVNEYGSFTIEMYRKVSPASSPNLGHCNSNATSGPYQSLGYTRTFDDFSRWDTLRGYYPSGSGGFASQVFHFCEYLDTFYKSGSLTHNLNGVYWGSRPGTTVWLQSYSKVDPYLRMFPHGHFIKASLAHY